MLFSWSALEPLSALHCTWYFMATDAKRNAEKQSSTTDAVHILRKQPMCQVPGRKLNRHCKVCLHNKVSLRCYTCNRPWWVPKSQKECTKQECNKTFIDAQVFFPFTFYVLVVCVLPFLMNYTQTYLFSLNIRTIREEYSTIGIYYCTVNQISQLLEWYEYENTADAD